MSFFFPQQGISADKAHRQRHISALHVVEHLIIARFCFATAWFCTAPTLGKNPSVPLSSVFTKPGLKSSLAQQCKLKCDSCNHFFSKSPTVDAAVSVRDIFFYHYELFNIYNGYKILLADCLATLENITKGQYSTVRLRGFCEIQAFQPWLNSEGWLGCSEATSCPEARVIQDISTSFVGNTLASMDLFFSRDRDLELTAMRSWPDSQLLSPRLLSKSLSSPVS